jgi:ketosteroid isomerase-like protein
MSQQNVELIRSLYAAFGRGDVPAVLAAMDPAIEWNEAEGFPYADRNPYVGPGAIVEGVFARLGAEWEAFSVGPREFLDAGEAVVVLGRYRGAFRKTGRRIDAQFAHVWRLRGGQVVAFQQYTDTLQAARATGAHERPVETAGL